MGFRLKMEVAFFPAACYTAKKEIFYKEMGV